MIGEQGIIGLPDRSVTFCSLVRHLSQLCTIFSQQYSSIIGEHHRIAREVSQLLGDSRPKHDDAKVTQRVLIEELPDELSQDACTPG